MSQHLRERGEGGMLRRVLNARPKNSRERIGRRLFVLLFFPSSFWIQAFCVLCLCSLCLAMVPDLNCSHISSSDPSLLLKAFPDRAFRFSSPTRTTTSLQIEAAAHTNGSASSPPDPGHSARGPEWHSLFATVNGQVSSEPVNEKKTLDVVAADREGDFLGLTPKEINLPRPLSISDLSPAPMHGSLLRVAYQGVPGAYSEAAACKAYPQCEPVPCDQFEVAFQAVELWLADRAVLPVENSLGGSIHRNYDLLLRHRLHIVGEVQLPVHHCLLALPGVSKEDLRRVISHPQALAQCEQTLTRLGLDISREAVDDTAGAGQFIAENNLRDTAAIASFRAAEIYGLQVMANGIQDDSANVTRFVMLAREPIIPRTDRPFKTSIVFAHEETTGALFKVLSAFAFRKINLTKIESRPQRKRALRVVDDSNRGKAKYFEYLFYIDFEASMADPRAQNALGEIQEFTTFLRVLGSYPMYMTPLERSPCSE